MQQPTDQSEGFFCGFVPGSGWVISRVRDKKEFSLGSFYEEFGYYPPRPDFDNAEQRQAWEEYQPPGEYCVVESSPEELAIAMTKDEEPDTILFSGTEQECEQCIKDYFSTAGEDDW